MERARKRRGQAHHAHREHGERLQRRIRVGIDLRE
jgi:hypothetical protein